jgi:hypothetical protein
MEDLEQGRLHPVAMPAPLRSPFQRIVSLERGWLSRSPTPRITVRAEKKEHQLRIAIENETSQPIALNPVAFQYGRARMWTIRRGDEKDGKGYRELRLTLGSVLFRYPMAVSSDRLVLVDSGKSWETVLSLPRNAPSRVLVEFYDRFAVEGRTPCPLLVRFQARAGP